MTVLSRSLVTLLVAAALTGGAQGEFADLALGGSLGTSTVWACVTLKSGGMECFTPSSSPGGDGNFYERAAFLPTTTTYDQVVVSGGGSSSVWACATATSPSTTTDCTRLIRTDALEVDGHFGNSMQADIGAGDSPTIYACIIFADNTGLGCGRLSTTGGEEVPLDATLLGNNIRQVAVGGGRSTSVYGCALMGTDNISCFRPTAWASGSYEIIGTVPGNYGDVSVGGAGSTTVMACAVNVGTGGNVDCWRVSSSTFDITGRLVGQQYSTVSVGGSSSTSIYACAVAAGRIDCIRPSSLSDDNNEYEIIGSLVGDYSKVSVSGGSTSSAYACGLLSDGTRVDCFRVSSLPQDDGTYEIIGSYLPPTPQPTSFPTLPPTPQPTSFPTLSPAPTNQPSPFPTASPTITASPTDAPVESSSAGAAFPMIASLLCATMWTVNLLQV